MDLESLRRELIKRQDDARRKIRYNSKTKGIDIPHPDFRSVENINRYNARQLQSNLDRMNAFMSRRNQYYRASDGSVISSEQVREYRRQLRNANRRVGTRRANWDKNILNTLGYSERDIRAMTDRGYYSPIPGESIGRLGKEVAKKPNQFGSAAAIEKRIKQLKKLGTPEHDKTLARDAKKDFTKMADAFGSKRVAERLKKLRGQKLVLAYNSRKIMESLKRVYEADKIVGEGEGAMYNTAKNIVDNEEEDLIETLDKLINS